MKEKTKFKVGDRVRFKDNPQIGKGKIVKKDTYGFVGYVGTKKEYNMELFNSPVVIKELFEKVCQLASTPIDKRTEVKELTVNEVSELLGYEVKIKGEK